MSSTRRAAAGSKKNAVAGSSRNVVRQDSMSAERDTIGAKMEAEKREEEDKIKKQEQEELRKKVIQENLLKDPIITYVNELNQHIVEDPLFFEGVQGAPEEWTNIPSLIARFLIRNQ